MKRIYSLVIVALLFTSNYTFSQHEEDEHEDHIEECGARHTKASLAYEKNTHKLWEEYKKNHKSLAGGEVLSFPVQIHILRQSDGTGGLTITELDDMMERLNEIYLEAKVIFYQCGSINYIDDDSYYDFDGADEGTITATHDVANVCNIYFCNSITDEGSGLCGYAYYPGGPNRVFMDNGCAKNGSTLAHEMGHYFALPHTHNGTTELVDGSNCATAGDNFCDTPADPQLGGGNVDDNGCTYFGTDTDGNGQLYTPDVTNIMSYAPRACRFSFSNEQLARIRFIAENSSSRTNLTCGSAVPLDSKFSGDVLSTCTNNLTVQFYDLSDGSITGWSWDFGDGSPLSTDQDPTHTYSGAGAYDVTLTISDGGSNSVLTKAAYIKVGTVSVPYSQDFESADALDDFKITDALKNFTTRETDAGNTASAGMSMQGFPENITPTFQTPTAADAFDENNNHYFKSKADLCVDATTLTSMQLEFDYQQIEYIDDLYTNFRVLVNGNQVGIYNPSGSTTAWTAESINLDAYVGQVVTITFEASNKYSRDYGGSSTSGNATYIDNINITGSTAPNTANFSVDATSGCTTSSYTFTSQSSGTIANYSWDFGSGATPPTATGVGPHVVTYSTEGDKTVSLTVDDGGVNNDTETKTNYITIDNAPCTDCNNELGGTAYLDGCSFCVGGSTGEDPCLPYCTSDFTNTGSEYISNVSINTIDNNSGDAPTDGYEDYTSLSTDLSQGSTHNLSVTINTFGNYTDHCFAFFDWNRDGDFYDTDESIDLGEVTNETAGILSTNVQVPIGATIGTIRMRISIAYIEDPGPCEEHTTEYGEAEDYTINITTAVNDCHGDPGGSAFIDNCSDCVGGNTGQIACTQDCNGDFGGTAFTDNCSDCVGGNTGQTACTQDCNGDFGGTAFTDNCSDCVGGNTGQTACTQDCNGDFGGTATIDGCSDCVGGNTGQTACAQDCNGDFGGTATIDDCSNCVGGNTGQTACTQDCNGDFGGTAATDVCGECAGGNTGITPETNSANCITSISDLENAGIKAFPNPFGNSIQIEIEEGFGGIATIEVYSTSGVLLETTSCESNKSVNVGSNLPSGVYQVKIFNSEKLETISITKL